MRMHINWGVTSGNTRSIAQRKDVLGTTSGAGLAPNSNVWHYVEIKIVAATSGSVTIRVDGVTKLTITGINTTDGSNRYVSVNIVAAPQWRLDDFYICDSTGSANNTFSARRL